MAKKITEKLSKEYLENKLKELEEQRIRLEDRIEQYTQMWQKVVGATEVVQDMLDEFNKDESTEASVGDSNSK